MVVSPCVNFTPSPSIIASLATNKAANPKIKLAARRTELSITPIGGTIKEAISNEMDANRQSHSAMLVLVLMRFVAARNLASVVISFYLCVIAFSR